MMNMEVDWHTIIHTVDNGGHGSSLVLWVFLRSFKIWIVNMGRLVLLSVIFIYDWMGILKELVNFFSYL